MPPDRDRSRRTSPTMADYGRSIWRRKFVVLVALLAGLVLGTTVLPNALANRGTEKASVRMRVGQTATDAIAAQAPADAARPEDAVVSDPLNDAAVAQSVVNSLGPARGDLTADALLKGLSAAPLAGTNLVDLVYVDHSGSRAVAVARNYAKLWAARRNAEDARHVKAILTNYELRRRALELQIQQLSDQAD